MNVRRFTARTSRDALVLVRQALGEDAVVLSTKPCADGVEVLAMAPETMRQVEKLAAKQPAPAARPAPSAAAGTARSLAARAGTRIEPTLAVKPVEEDVTELSMSTLSFQDYVRERMLRRRQASLAADVRRDQAKGGEAGEAHTAKPVSDRASVLEQRMNERQASPVISAAPLRESTLREPPATRELGAGRELSVAREPQPREALRREPPVLRDTVATRMTDIAMPRLADAESDVDAAGRAAHRQSPSFDRAPAPHSHGVPAGVAQPMSEQAHARRDQDDMMGELRAMKGLIEERFGALAFMEKLNRQPAQARLTQRLLDCGFSPALIRKLGDSLPMDAPDEAVWAAGVLERNLITAEAETALEDQGGVYALVGATGVGKTTTTAKIAAAFATKYGAGNLGLITLDAYRIGAHEQLRAYGRILGVPVHTAHDRASLEDLLDLLAAKKMVLIDTAGMAQRDSRTRELLEMLSHRSIQKLLVVNAASQGETIEDVMISYRASLCRGIVLSKMDEAVKLGPALDALIRHKLKVVGVANGQRVPEDWHRLSANALVGRAMRGGGSSAYKLDASDVALIFTAPMPPPHAHAHAHPPSSAASLRPPALHGG